MKPGSGQYIGTYVATVEDNNDPSKLGRIKARSSVVYGPANDAVPTSALPWANPAGLPQGGSASSGGLSWIPNIGDHVLLRFLDGEPEKPIWEWGGQDAKQNKGYNPHPYKDGKAPDRVSLSRYGHAIEIGKEGLILTSKAGYTMSITDADFGVPNGAISIISALGNFVTLDDSLGILQTHSTNVSISCLEEIQIMTNSMSLTALTGIDINSVKTFEVTTTNLGLTASAKATISSPNTEIDSAMIKLGSSASDPLIRKSDLEPLINWLQSHFHGNGNDGFPTSQPVVPPSPVVGSLKLLAT